MHQRNTKKSTHLVNLAQFETTIYNDRSTRVTQAVKWLILNTNDVEDLSIHASISYEPVLA